MDIVTQNLQDKVAEILDPYYSGHPITFNHYLTDIVQKKQNNRYLKAIEAGVEHYFQSYGVSEHDSDFAAIARTVAEH